MPQLAEAARALLLLILANSLPWLAGRALNARWAMPLDLGLVLADGQRLLGSHKTWRGLVVAICGCALAAGFSGLHWRTGAALAALSLLGDAFSSLCKRRLALAPGSSVALLDQLPEALLPLLALRSSLGLDPITIAAVAGIFTLLGVVAASLWQRAAVGTLPRPPG